MTDFTKLEIGTKVWSLSLGWGELIEITWDVIKVKFNLPEMVAKETFFPETERILHFQHDGKISERDERPNLFLQPFEIPDSAYEKPLPNLEVGQLLYCWSDPLGKVYKRRFHHFDSKTTEPAVWVLINGADFETVERDEYGEPKLNWFRYWSLTDPKEK